MGILRKWVLGSETEIGIQGVVDGNNTCGKEVGGRKEVGLGRERSELQCSSNGGLRSLQRVLKMGWPFRLVVNWVRE